MQAIVIHEGGGPEVLKYEEVPDPTAADGKVLVRLEAAGINHFDLNQRQAPEATGATPPFTPGMDGAGTREDTGERVLVSGSLGTYAELVAAAGETRPPDPGFARRSARGRARRRLQDRLGKPRRRGPPEGRASARAGGLERNGPGGDRHRPLPRRGDLRDREPERSTTTSASSAPSRSPTTTRRSRSSARRSSSTPFSATASSSASRRSPLPAGSSRAAHSTRRWSPSTCGRSSASACGSSGAEAGP